MKITILQECSDFLKMSQGQPLLKPLPADGPDTRKVKVRKKKTISEVAAIFNEVFSEPTDLYQRCILANGSSTSIETKPTHDMFFIFPVNGFKFMYSPNVGYMEYEYGERLAELRKATNLEEGKKLLQDVLEFEYVQNENLLNAIQSGDEIIIYGVPYFYAIRESSVENYSTLFSL